VMDLTGAELGAFIAAMFAFTNPFILPVPFLELAAEYPAEVRRPFAIVAVFTQLVTFLIVTWFGSDLLDLLGVSIDGITVAGAILILSFGVPMAMGTSKATGASPPGDVAGVDVTEKNWRAAAVSPVGIPILVGGAHFALLISTTARFSSTQSLITVSAVCLGASAMTLVALLLAGPLFKRLGDTGKAITVRVFGFIVMALGFDVLATGLNGLFPGLTS
jgi:multiple antibiotic resistance protein